MLVYDKMLATLLMPLTCLLVAFVPTGRLQSCAET